MSEPRNVTPGQPEWTGWTWARRGWNFPWLGVLLVLVGVGLLVQYLVPGVGAGTLILLAIGLAFFAAWLIGRSWIAMVPGLLILALAAARLIDDLGIYTGPGTTALCLAGAFGLIWLIGYSRGQRGSWSLWGLAVFGLIGLVQASERIVGLPELGALWPIVVIVLGVLLLVAARRR